jgi:ketosteroid isomerase-like protein
MAVDAPALVDSLMALWRGPLSDGDAAHAEFARLYADPLTVNRTVLARNDLVTRARTLHAAYDDLAMEVLDVVGTADRVVVAFLMRARHTGPLTTPLGVVAPTGRQITVRTIDVLTVRDGLITAITVVADELGLLTQLGAVRLSGVSPDGR